MVLSENFIQLNKVQISLFFARAHNLINVTRSNDSLSKKLLLLRGENVCLRVDACTTKCSIVHNILTLSVLMHL